HIFLLIIIFNLSNSSNIDTNFPIVLSHNGKESSYFGASVTIAQGLRKSDLIVGAPKYSGNDHEKTGAIFACEIDQSNNATCRERSFIKDYQTKHDRAEYYYSDAVSGTSSAMKEPIIAIGAPGFSDWQGSVVVYHTANLDTASIMYDNHDYNSYMGYSVAIGQFFNDRVNYIAAGAPRSKETGCVKAEISLQPPNRLYKLNDPLKKCGDQFLEYFGASVIAVDVNKDRLMDLIVGSPLYSHSTKYRGDSGRIFVYLSLGRSFDSPSIISIEKNRGARFGSALASLGDLNYDGFNDVAVGAPYEDDGQGAVYIYFGTRFGLSKNYVQRIAASDQLSSLQLRGFGQSLSTGHDVDNNDYPDLLVGSYLSDKAILLRSRPVASLKVSIKFREHNENKVGDEITQINLKNQNCQLKSVDYSCFDVVYCLLFSGEFLPQNQKVIVSFEIDSKLKRRGFAEIENSELYQFDLEAVVKPKINRCMEPVTIYLNPKLEDKLTPMNIALRAKLSEEDQKSQFCKKCPILSNEPFALRSLNFETGCGDVHCIAELQLDVRSSLLLVVQGLNTELPLYVQITNNGENAYSTKLRLEIRPFVEVNQISSHCEDTTEEFAVIIDCDIDNPLETEQTKEIFFMFDLSKLSSNVQNITIDSSVTTLSNLSEKSNANQRIILDVKRFASLLLLRGEKSHQELYAGAGSREKEYVRFSSLLQVVKENYSSVDEVNIAFKIPSIAKNNFISFQPRINLENKPSRNFLMKCDYPKTKLPELPKEESFVDPSKESDVEKSKLRTEEPKVAKRDVSKQLKEETKNATAENEEILLKLNCETTECETVVCQIGPFGINHQTALLEIENAINLTGVENVFKTNYSGILFTIEVEAKITDKSINSDIYRAYLPTVFKRIPTPEAVSSWIIFASSGIGLLLFIIIFVLLLKFGFFQRKQREEMQRLMRENDKKRDFGATNVNETNRESSIGDDSS
ncbi:Integrin alpha-9-like protein, partial [Dinothrombium tinctorium]